MLHSSKGVRLPSMVMLSPPPPPGSRLGCVWSSGGGVPDPWMYQGRNISIMAADKGLTEAISILTGEHHILC